MGDVPYHLYVVDNASPNREVANAFFAENKVERLITLKTNVGYPGGCNTGVRMGKSQYVLILTPDVWYEKNAVAELYHTMMSDVTIGVVCPKLVFPENTPHGRAGTIQHAGVDFNIRAEPTHTFIGWDKNHPKANVPAQVPACTGASFLTRRALWNQVGGFFEGYGVGTYEDIEYCLTLGSLGFKTMYEPKAEATHHVNATNQAYPLGLNSQIFQVRCGSLLEWTQWLRF
jgi:GT2 family glycosyltransferase